MKKKILSLISCTAIIALMVFNTHVTTNINSTNFKLSSVVAQTEANAENDACPGWDGEEELCIWSGRDCSWKAECACLCYGGC